MDAPTQTSGGGTADGVEGAVVAAIDGVTRNNVEIIEHHNPPDSDPGPYEGAPYTEVVVDGGIDAEVADVIDTSKPCGPGAVLTRPTELDIDIDATVVAAHDAGDINTTRIGDSVTEYVSGLGLGDDFYRAQLYETMMDADEDAINVTDLTVTINGTAVSGDYSVSDKEVIRASSATIDATVLES